MHFRSNGCRVLFMGWFHCRRVSLPHHVRVNCRTTHLVFWMCTWASLILRLNIISQANCAFRRSSCGAANQPHNVIPAKLMSRSNNHRVTCRVSKNDSKGSCAPSNGLGFHTLQSCTATSSILACETRLRWFTVFRFDPQLTQAAANSCPRANAAREWDFCCFECSSIMLRIFEPRIQPWLSTPNPDSLWEFGCDIASCVLQKL